MCSVLASAAQSNSKSARIQALFGSPLNPQFYDAIRKAYLDHWGASAQLVTDALRKAEAVYLAWWESAQAKIFSSIPGTSCGVADYSVAYVRSATGNVAFFFSEGEQENISPLKNVRVFTHLDFNRLTAKFRGLKGVFNFAFSSALHPGIRLVRTASRSGDVFSYMSVAISMVFARCSSRQTVSDELLLDVAAAETDDDRTRIGDRLRFSCRSSTATIRS